MKNNHSISHGIISVMIILLFTSCSTKYGVSKVDSILYLIQDEYVNDLNHTKLEQDTIDYLIHKLDSHSVYLSGKDLENFLISISGQFAGIGISMHIENKLLTVITPIDNTPAQQAGIQSGDVILQINNTSTLGLSLEQCITLTKGDAGTQLQLTILRKGIKQPLQFNITRAHINSNPISATLLQDKILYIRIPIFNQQTNLAFKKILNQYPQKKGIILDLRYNPGGVLNEAIALVNTFVDKGIIVSQKGRLDKYNTTFYANSTDTDTSTPLIVLINEGSASASEIVSGALKYYKRAILVGAKSFGKGTVQTLFPLDEHSALKMTIAKYYLPNGKCIDKVGIQPDFIVKNRKYTQHTHTTVTYQKAQKLLYKLTHKMIMPSIPKEKISTNSFKRTSKMTPLKIQKDQQLQQALKLLKNSN